MNVTLLYAPMPREVIEMQLSLNAGCTAEQALMQTDWTKRYPEVVSGLVFMSIWGKNVDADTVLQEGDRLEFCRALRVDPKVARRERFVGQGARGTGLFSQRRPGSKAGY